ncbi:MAG: hypothetical protein CFE21_03565 [Bacteroidetes bacterium B1(2017)]|nr:MAG: hypothetical protein CFE21_03565 [Bacteroidetes bacterium B1(2017)]
MIMPSDKVYKVTKQILLGKKEMKLEFKPLAAWIDNTYGVKTISIFYDTIDKGIRPRLEICFEYASEKDLFMGLDKCSFDTEKQKAIGKKFEEILIQQGLIKGTGLVGLFKRQIPSKYKTEDIWVIYGSFESIAKIEANESIPEGKVTALKEELNNQDIWEISRAFAGTTVFLYTDEQVKKYTNSEEHNRWSLKYFDLLSEYDEFKYFKREFFSVTIDSKENFDNNYQSNWFYYYK